MTVSYDIVPHTGAADIRFGMDRSEVHAVSGLPLLSFDRGSERNTPPRTEKYERFFVEYSSAGRCVSIEFFEGDVRLMGRSLLRKPYAEVLAWLASLDGRLLCDDSGCTSLSLGLGVYAPVAALARPGARNLGGEQSVSETVIAFGRGYYDSLLEKYPSALGEPYATWIEGGQANG